MPLEAPRMSAQRSRSSVIGSLRVIGSSRSLAAGPASIGQVRCRRAGVHVNWPVGSGPVGSPPSAGSGGYAEVAVTELKTEQILALLAPIVIIQLGLMIV